MAIGRGMGRGKGRWRRTCRRGFRGDKGDVGGLASATSVFLEDTTDDIAGLEVVRFEGRDKGVP